MVTVFVWTFRLKPWAVGHASLQVGGDYISWWPDRTGPGVSKGRPVPFAWPPYRGRTFAEDVRDEHGRSPDHTVRIDGLDEPAIRNWWRSYGLVRDGVAAPGPLLPWHATEQNCATVAARALRIGGSDAYAKWVHTWNFVWTPTDVVRYATSVQRGVLAKGRKPARSVSR